MAKSLEKKNRSSQKILITISTVLVVAAVFLTSYYFIYDKTTSKYTNALYNIKLDVDEANSSVAKSTSEMDKLDSTDTQEIDGIKKIVSEADSKLKKSIDSLKNVTPPAKYANQYKQYLEGLTLNKRIFTQINLILKNTKSKDLENALNSLHDYINETKIAYEASKLGKSYIKLPNDMFTLEEKIRSYAMSSYSDYIAKTTALEQYTIYFTDMDKIVEDFKIQATDLSEILTGIQNNQSSIGDGYRTIEDKLSKLNDIKNRYNGLTVPQKTVNQHQGFNDIINSYTYYCQDFKSNLTKLEEAGSSEENLMDVNMTFDELYVRYKEISKNFSDYLESYNGDKTFYQDINNL
jgi:hypothetical protein